MKLRSCVQFVEEHAVVRTAWQVNVTAVKVRSDIKHGCFLYSNNVSVTAYFDTSVFVLLFQAYLSGKSRVDRILHFHYLICMLLPVLKRLSEDREAELEREAKIRSSYYFLSSNIDVYQSSFCWLQMYLRCLFV